MDWLAKKPVGGSKYGLQLKLALPASKKPQLKKPLPFPVDGGDDHGEYTVEDDIARQASKKKSSIEVDVQIKKALEQDSKAFDYDGVYEQMKGKQAQPIREDRAKREPKYIGKLLDKAKVRAVEHDIAFERRLAKEREKEDHLFGDKETFVTSAYKKKLIEMGKWKEEERLRELSEKSHEVSGKRDLSDFYLNLLNKNVSFGGKDSAKEKPLHGQEARIQVQGDDRSLGTDQETSSNPLDLEKETCDGLEEQSRTGFRRPRHNEKSSEDRSPLCSPSDEQHREDLEEGSKEENAAMSSGSVQQHAPETSAKKEGLMSGASAGDHRSKEESLTAAKERYLARKRQRNNF